MKIASSEILFSAQHSLSERHVREESLVVGLSSRADAWEPSLLEGGILGAREQEQDQPYEEGTRLLDKYLDGSTLADIERLAASTAANASTGVGRARRDLSAMSRAAAAGSPFLDLATLGEAVMAHGPTGLEIGLLGQLMPGVAEPLAGMAPMDLEAGPEDRFKMQLIMAAVAAFGGKEILLLEPGDLDLGEPETGSLESGPQTVQEVATGEKSPETEVGDEGGAGVFGLRYRYRETHLERETTSFQAAGVVHTSDGQKISIDVSLTMARQFTSEESLEVKIGGALQDPLVINFEGTAAELSERHYEFDLDSDGEAEQIRFVGPNSGFLALDKNGNGLVDDGGELFGPSTGQGFGELSAYDEDGNGFIDEGDSVYSGLRIWQKDSQGGDHLLALGQRGIGAIYLGHIDTPFEVKDEENALEGVVRTSGIYLNEDGSAGTVQQLDLVI